MIGVIFDAFKRMCMEGFTEIFFWLKQGLVGGSVQNVDASKILYKITCLLGMY